jgi:hypothetical protein
MGLFNFINKKRENNAAITMLPVTDQIQEQENAVVSTPVEPQEESEQKQKTLTVSYATGWPIDVIYGYLHKNYEEQGFNDAMIKSDMKFMEMNMNIITNKILMVFREINLNYDVMTTDLETRMEACSSAGLMSTLSSLEKQMTIVKTHKEELKNLENDFRNNANEASVPLQSYQCGFLRGIAAINLYTPAQKSALHFPSTTMNNSEAKVSA